MRICKCGRSIIPRYNSTIHAEKCPKCQYEDALEIKKVNHILNKKKNRSPKSNAMDRADKYFSQYIRLKNAIYKSGMLVAKDIITGKYYNILRLDCGHFISRGKMATRYDELNCYPQNRSSNRFSGECDKDKFRDNIVRIHGEDVILALEKRRNDHVDTSLEYFNNISDIYREKVNELQKQLGISVFNKVVVK